MDRTRGILALLGRLPPEWLGQVEAHVVVDALALGLIAVSVALLGSLVV
jgi:hypothetical protein